MPADGFVELTQEKLQSDAGVMELNRMLQLLFELVAGDGDSVRVFNGYGSPETVIAAGIGSLFLRRDGSTNTAVYKKVADEGKATGWVAIHVSV